MYRLIDLGKPEENPGIKSDPINDPVPRDVPKEIPVDPIRTPAKVPVPA